MMAYNGSDRRDIRRVEKKVKVITFEDDLIITQIMSSQSGRAWMFRTLSICSLYTDGYADIPGRMAFVSGQRNIGLRIQEGVLRACPDQYIAMLRESHVRDAADDARRSRDHEERGRIDSAAEDGGDETGTGFEDGPGEDDRSYQDK